MANSKKIGDVKLGREVIDRFADFDRLSTEECKNLEMKENDCQLLQGVLGPGRGGWLSYEEMVSLSSRFTDEFVNVLAEDRGEVALRQRTLWLRNNAQSVYQLVSKNLQDPHADRDTLIDMAWIIEMTRFTSTETRSLIVDDLIKSLQNSKDDEALQSYVGALCQIGPDAKDAIPTLVDIWGSKKVDRDVHECLEKMGAPSEKDIPLLAKMLHRGNKELAAIVLAKLGSKAIPIFIEAFLSKDRTVQKIAVDAIGNIGIEANHTIPLLVKTLDETGVDDDLILAIVKALKLMATHSEDAVLSLIKLLNSQNSELRTEAVKALGEMGNETNEVVLALSNAALNDNDPSVRYHAVGAITKCCGKAAIPTLISVMEDQNNSFPYGNRAPYELSLFGPSVLPLVAEKFQNGCEELRLNLVIVLRYVSQEYPQEAIPLLLKALEDDSAVVRINAVKALAEVKGNMKNAVPFLIKALQDRNSTVSGYAVIALKNIGAEAKEAVPTLIDLSGDKSTSLTVLGALVVLCKDDLEPLTNALKNPRPEIREAIAYVLANMGPSAKNSLQALRSLKNDIDYEVRRAAQTAIEQIEK